MKYYIISGEASGDLHGANLMRAILQRDSDAEIRFWGGDGMIAAGGTCVRHIRDLAYMGFFEVVTHLGAVLGNIRFCKKDIALFRPDVMVFVDYPGFNLKIARYTHRLGIKNVHYISPQLWAWKKNRIHSMRRDLDRLCCILPFEMDFYAKNDFPAAVYVGHPLLDAVDQFSSPSVTSHADNRPLVALLPGSRKQELRKLLPAMLQLAERHKECRFSIAAMTLLGEAFYEQLAPKGFPDNVSLCFDGTYAILSQSRAAVVCSGTATLEAALFKVPQVVCYRSSALSVAIARRLVGKRIRFISLPNLIADKEAVAELIQDDLSDERLDSEFLRILADGEARFRMTADYEDIIAKLGGAGASERVADIILQTVRDK